MKAEPTFNFSTIGLAMSETPALFTLDAVTDTILALTFLIIPAGIIYFIRKKEDFAFRWTFTLFALLLLFCGFTFATDMLTLWKSYYWFDVALQTITAIIAVITTLLLYPLLNKLIKLPGHQQLEDVNRLLEAQLLKQKETEEKLVKREKQLLKAQKIARLGLTEWDLIKGEAEISEELYEIYGFEANKELSIQELNSIIHPDDKERVGEIIKRTIAEKVPFSYSFRIITSKNEEKILFVQGETSFASDETPLKRISIVQDITQIKSLENELVEAQEKFKHAFDYAPIGVAIISPEGRFIKVNRAFCKMLGYDEEEILLSGIHEITHPKDLRKDSKLMEQIHSGDLFVFQSEKRFKHKNGNDIDVLTNVSLVRDKDGHPLYDIMQVLNITQKKQAEKELNEIHAELRKANDKLETKIKERTEELAMTNRQLVSEIKEKEQIEKELNESIENMKELHEELKIHTSKLEIINKELEAFSYSVSHDLKTPLRTIDGFSQILFEDYNALLDDAGKNMLQKIRSNSQKMAELIDSLLKLAQLSKYEMEFTLVNLSEIAFTVVEELKGLNPERDVLCRMERDIWVNGDKALLLVLFSNLLGNAWKFTSGCTSPVIEFGRLRGASVETFFVRDNGAGFDMRYAQKIFSPFQRAHKASEYQGTGVGLATVQRIIQRHGGEIRAEGKVGEGAVFYFTLPKAYS